MPNLSRAGLMLAAFLCCWSFAGDDPLASRILSSLRSWYRNYPQEKIYTQTDKAVYRSGETVWYKVYATAYGRRSEISQIVYLQLINSEGQVVISNKQPLVNGMASGNFQLPDSLPGNFYQLRAFTAWMLNFDEASLFHKSLYIKKVAEVKRAVSAAPTIRSWHVQFFPEGGDLIDGIESNVAFKVTDGTGQPADANMEVRDSSHVIIPSIRTMHDGMGQFAIRPALGRDYFAVLHFPDQSLKTILLPAARAYGIALKVVGQDPDQVAVEVRYRGSTKDAYRDAVLAASQTAGRMAAFPLDLGPGRNTFNISCKGFTTGILRLTVFDQEGIPQAERIVFVKKDAPLQLQVNGDSLSFLEKTRAAFGFRPPDMQIAGDTIHLSVSVTDAGRTVDDDWNDNICSALFLSSEIKGYIHHPAFYFSRNDSTTNRALDLVMMTNGWRRFDWKPVLDHEALTLKFAPEESLDLAGSIDGLKKSSGKRAPSLKLLIVNADSTRFMGIVSPDTNGRFVIRGYNVKGNSQVFLQGMDHKGNDRDIRVSFLLNPVDTVRTPIYEIPSPVGEDSIGYLIRREGQDEQLTGDNRHKPVILTPAIVRKQLPTKTEQVIRRYVSPDFVAPVTYDLDLITNPTMNQLRIFDFLKGKFAGLLVEGSEDKPLFVLHNQSTRAEISVPYFYINEIQTTWNEVRNLPLTEVAVIRYMEPPASMAPLNGGFIGVMAIYLKKWDEGIDSSNIADRFHHFIFHGFTVTREFYSPDNDDHLQDLPVQDNKSILYWNPNVVVTDNRPARISFFHPDAVRQFRVVVEGMDSKGRLVSSVSLFSSKH